jgi:hypothetical protein
MAKDLANIVPPSHLDGRAVRHFRRAFVKSLRVGRRLTVVEGQLVDRAAMLSIQAKAALVDPSVSSTDRVRLDGAARRATKDAVALIDAGRKHAPATPSLGDLLRADLSEASHG